MASVVFKPQCSDLECHVVRVRAKRLLRGVYFRVADRLRISFPPLRIVSNPLKEFPSGQSVCEPDGQLVNGLA